MTKIKNKNYRLQNNICTNCFKSNHIVFNFAYITYSDNFNKDEKSTMIDRMREISSVTYLELMRWDKYKGLEEERIKINKNIPIEFCRDIEQFDGKYTIMRLYKNNYPTPGRIIGKLINKVFYIFFIDTKGVLYNHGK